MESLLGSQGQSVVVAHIIRICAFAYVTNQRARSTGAVRRASWSRSAWTVCGVTLQTLTATAELHFDLYSMIIRLLKLPSIAALLPLLQGITRLSYTFC